MRVLLATVQHTGTMFTLRHMERHFLDATMRNPRGWSQAIGDFGASGMREAPIVAGHLFDENMAFVMDWPDAIVTTRRNEDDTRDSWMRRHGTVVGLDEELANYRKLLIERWCMVVDIDERTGPAWVTDWEPFNTWR